MSWVADEWKQGLPHKALLKIEELEQQKDRATKDSQNKQFRLETLEQVCIRERLQS